MQDFVRLQCILGLAFHELPNQDADRGEHGDAPVRQLRLARGRGGRGPAGAGGRAGSVGTQRRGEPAPPPSGRGCPGDHLEKIRNERARANPQEKTRWSDPNGNPKRQKRRRATGQEEARRRGQRSMHAPATRATSGRARRYDTRVACARHRCDLPQKPTTTRVVAVCGLLRCLKRESGRARPGRRAAGGGAPRTHLPVALERVGLDLGEAEGVEAVDEGRHGPVQPERVCARRQLGERCTRWRGEGRGGARWGVLAKRAHHTEASGDTTGSRRRRGGRGDPSPQQRHEPTVREVGVRGDGGGTNLAR